MSKELLFTSSYVNGEWIKGSETTFDVLNPANGEKVAAVFNGGVAVTNLAIDVAHEAFATWKKTTAKYRSVILEKLNNLILENTDELARIMTLECGKPLAESKGEVAYAASFVKWFAEEGKRMYGDTIPAPTEDRRIVVIKQPIGVVAAMTPWNFPLAMITRKIAPALAAGCTVIVRPTYESPLTALALAHLAEKAGFPKGVFNTVVGNDSITMGKAICENDKVSKISFTGSTRVGQILMEQSASTLKKLSLELGGNAPFIVFEDADIDKAVEGAMVSKYRNAGQTCVCVNRILVHDKVYDEFTAKLAKAVSKLKIGNGLDEGVQIGPLINKAAVEKTGDFITDALKKGGKLIAGGKALDNCFFEPTIIGDATTDMDFTQEEIFGPVAAIYRFSSDAQAIQMANDTIYGLASYFYSQNVSRCWKVAEALEYGMVGINEGLISTEVAPFGGVKYSGQGREGSKYGMDDYIEIKYLCFGNIR